MLPAPGPSRAPSGETIFAGPYEKAAALLHAIICDHVFVDGNKRTGTAAAIIMLSADSTLPPGNSHLRLALLGQVSLAAASSQLTVEQVTFWIRRIFEPPGA
jgi:death-on-curing protein